ncbi:hypothetical protein AB0B01_21710 [Streptomyces sp. NPDC044571]|uniref:hypothetical protein n=1 Tax=Streptomyces sp. NPDC044571 TaxID=3155371 RepID=UPI003404C3CD
MRVRRLLAAAIAAAALAGAGLTGAATAQASAPDISGYDCTYAGGKVVYYGDHKYCQGGKYDGYTVY